MAEGLYKQEPNDPMVASTYGLSLYKLGRPWEAVAVMNTFTPEQLKSPGVAPYYGVFLAAAGQIDQAAPYLNLPTKASLLPEERALIAKVQGAAPPPPVGEIDRSRTDTLELYKESRQKFLAEPQNVTARNNYILLALLSKQNVDSAHQLARALYKEHPADPAVAASYGLSLYDQDKPDEAVTVMDTLKPEQLNEPVIASYYGLFLAAAGHAEKAQKYLQLGAQAAMLPEEKTLIAKTAH